MSRLAKKPLKIPANVDIELEGGKVTAKGPKGQIDLAVEGGVQVRREGDTLAVGTDGDKSFAMVGTIRSLLANMIIGVSQGFERKLELVGVGYRAQLQGDNLSLALGYSHPVNYAVPEGVTIQTPSQTEILIQGVDKQQVGQVAANIRAFRAPEPYKGKGVKYANEQIMRKEAKKK
jgi:large subunit ribosomal protein L6